MQKKTIPEEHTEATWGNRRRGWNPPCHW